MTELNSSLDQYGRAAKLAEAGAFSEARQLYEQLRQTITDKNLLAVVTNDLGVLAAVEGNAAIAHRLFTDAIATDPQCDVAQTNLDLLTANGEATSQRDRSAAGISADCRQTRVAILSLLFNWPSTGGGTIHTAELGQFLSHAGYAVCHYYACFPEWGLGNVRSSPSPCEPIRFTPSTWNRDGIIRRFRAALDSFQPDAVIITDSWNCKPLLAEAASGYRYFLRLAAMECLCPLNNIRLITDNVGSVVNCPLHQLATAESCRSCVSQREHLTGDLHRKERTLSGFGHDAYDRQLRKAFAEAEAVLTVNPLIAEMVKPYARRVRVVPSGFDSKRFLGIPERLSRDRSDEKKTILFAGLTDEFMKGWTVVVTACRKLWRVRQDFELLATADPDRRGDEFTRNLGWLSQDELAKQLETTDILVFPTIAEEALGRCAVEAMGAGCPVIGSRIGGLQFTVVDGYTGLLFEPGDVDDLARKIETLLDDAELRRQLGRNGRQRFLVEFTWERVIERHYVPLFGPPTRATDNQLCGSH